MIRTFQDGGPILFVIFAVSGASWFLIAWKFVALAVDKGVERRASGVVFASLIDESVETTRSLCLRHRCLSFCAIAAYLDVRSTSRDVDRSLKEQLVERESAGLRCHIDLIAASAGMMMLLGLLGTVVGIMITFRGLTLSSSAAMECMMANGISQALITTEAGLIAAIPALAAHSLLVARIRRRVASAERALARAEAILAKEEQVV
ncbi:MAG: MotA/TolQ/ExbB proton channel family protein [Candidatus Brocadiia bacterium]